MKSRSNPDAGTEWSENLRMAEFMGSPHPLPRATSRYGDDDVVSVDGESERVVHAQGYDEVAKDAPSFTSPEEIALWVDGRDLPPLALAIYCGNWLIAYRGEGHWAHSVEGRPEVYVAGIGNVDMVSVAEDLLRGNGRVFRHIASA